MESLLFALKKNEAPLKKTATTKTRRVVDSEGNIVYEQVEEVRGEDGLFKEVEGTARKVGKPSFAASAPDGDLVPRAFDASQKRWINVSSAQTECQNQRPLRESLRVVTFNTWFADVHFEQRAQGLIAVIQKSGAHVVNLQEVTPRLLEILKKDPFIQSTFVLSDSVGATLSPYGVIILVLREISVSSLKIHHISTNMARRYVAAELECGHGKKVHIGTVHMESLDCNAATRVKQIQEIFGSCSDGRRDSEKDVGIVTKSQACAAIVTGDFNFDPADGEEKQIPSFIEDAWMNGARLEGDSGITSPSGRHRIDRVMLYNASTPAAVWVTKIRRIGHKNIDGLDFSVSDHAGLCCDFMLEKAAI